MKIKPQVSFGLAAFIAFLTFLVYLPALQNGFVGWDDGMYVVDNPHIRSLDVFFSSGPSLIFMLPTGTRSFGLCIIYGRCHSEGR